MPANVLLNQIYITFFAGFFFKLKIVTGRVVFPDPPRIFINFLNLESGEHICKS